MAGKTDTGGGYLGKGRVEIVRYKPIVEAVFWELAPESLESPKIDRFAWAKERVGRASNGP